MLTVIRTTHSRNPWRLAWQGQLLADVGFARRRDALAVLQQLRAVADWTQPPDAWDAATRAAVVAVLDTVPSVVELERVRWERRPR